MSTPFLLITFKQNKIVLRGFGVLGFWGFGYHSKETLKPREDIISIVGNGHKYIIIGLERQDHYSAIVILEWVFNCGYLQEPYKEMCKIIIPPEFR